jgi:hypothetical protein
VPWATREDYRDADEVIISGGEPTRYWRLLLDLIHDIRTFSKAKIFVYTSNVDASKLRELALRADGLTLTLHTEDDLLKFTLDQDLWPMSHIRVKVDRDIVGMEWGYTALAMDGWNVEWFAMSDNCPLPEGETLMRYGR